MTFLHNRSSIFRNIAGLFLSAAFIVAITGCANQRAIQPMPQPVVAAPEDPKVDAGDILEIEVFGEKDLSGKFQVSEAGTIDYPLVGRVDVSQKTPPEVASILRERLAKGFLKDPHVRVFAEGFRNKRKVYVWGQVVKSGTFNYVSSMTVIEALTLSGGLTPLANKDGITVTRNVDGKLQRFAIPMSKADSGAYQLKPGDVIFVPERVF